MSSSEKDSNSDACPNCGTRVESAISAPGEPLREAIQRRCPNCGKVLRREVGGKWTIDEDEDTTGSTAPPTWEDEGGAVS